MEVYRLMLLCAGAHVQRRPTQAVRIQAGQIHKLY